MQRQIVTSCLIGLAALGCSSRGAPAVSDSLVAEARAFMSQYAMELSRGDREALIRRYDARGAFFVGDGTKEYWSADSVSSWYRRRWAAPVFVEFRDLSYEPLGDSAVAVLGQFRWTARGTADTMTFSYTAILLRRQARLGIRVEDESTDTTR